MATNIKSQEVKCAYIGGVAIGCLFATLNTYAAGFALSEQSASGLGNAFAGAAAVAEDATTIFYNPAGMTYLKDTELVVGGSAINVSGRFHNNGSRAPALRSLGGDGGNLGDLAFVPNIYFSTKVMPDLYFGLAVNVPFGLKTEYDNTWMGRYQAVKSEVKTININPSLAYRVNDKLSIGAGLSAMRLEAELTSRVNFVSPAIPDGTATVKGSDWGWGYNLGAIYQITPATRVGLAYRSKITEKLEGDVSFQKPAQLAYAPLLASNPAFANGAVTAGVTLPENATLSAFSKLNDRWDVMGSVSWTRWSRFDMLNVVRSSGTMVMSTREQWSNVMRYSLGANYHYSPTIMLRTGIAYDQEAIPDQNRTARIPGNDRTWLALGASWQATPQSRLDVGYAHVFIRDASIYDNQGVGVSPAAKGVVAGSYSGHADILSAQYVYDF